MCRWLAYSGTPIYIEELLFRTEHSLIDQSLAARLGATPTNGDGFGLGWYDEREAPGRYRDTHPAWNDSNLRDLAAHIQSPLFLAHVRATTGTPVQRTNCHPFAHGRWLFMHNGAVRRHALVKRALCMEVRPDLFPHIAGSTDTELMFYLALTLGLEDEPLPALERMAWLIEHIGQAAGVRHPLTMTLGVSDGQRLYAVRYSSERASRTLYHNRDLDTLARVYPAVDRFDDDDVVVVSEPLGPSDTWVELPESTALIVGGPQRVLQRPFRPRAP